MVKQFFNKIVVIGLALLVLLSTTSITVDKHYCGSKLVDLSVFFEADNCGMEMTASELNDTKTNSCCKDETNLIKGQKDLQKLIVEDIEFSHIVFLTTLIYSYTNQFEGLNERVNPLNHYIQPILVYDRQLLDEVFLI